MRVVFSFYGINIAIALLIISLASLTLEERNPQVFSTVFKCTLFYVYIIYGPLLLIISLVGIAQYSNSLFYVCDAVYGSRSTPDQVMNVRNLVQVCIAIVISLFVNLFFTFMYAIGRSQLDLRVEGSLMSRMYFWLVRRASRRN